MAYGGGVLNTFADDIEVVRGGGVQNQNANAIIQQDLIKIIGHKYNSCHLILVPKILILIILAPYNPNIFT